MIGAWLRHIMHPHTSRPMPRVHVSTEDERRMLERRQAEITARLELLRIEAEQPALRRGYRPPAERTGA